MIKKYVKISIVIITILVFLVIFFYINNNFLTINCITYTNSKIPDSFCGYKILQVSDLQNKKFGNNQKKLIDYTFKTSPDIIVITGDLIDRNKFNLDIVMKYISAITPYYPVYFVPGNHEWSCPEYSVLIDKLSEANVIILDDTSISIERNDKKINIIGIRDISFLYNTESGNSKDWFKNILSNLVTNNSEFNLLLSHRPELMDIYEQCNVDLVLSGHAHGGQIRIPFIGGLYAPHQGFFPKYTSGLYNKNNTSMIVSRGLGNSTFPFRIFNLPELVLITLNNK